MGSRCNHDPVAIARRSVRGTNLSYASLAEWLAFIYRIGEQIKLSRTHYARQEKLQFFVYKKKGAPINQCAGQGCRILGVADRLDLEFRWP